MEASLEDGDGYSNRPRETEQIMTNIAIIGGHGKVALRLAPLLVEAGDEVTSWIRSQDQVEDIEQTGAAAKVLDVQQLSTEQLSDEFEGVDVVIWSAGAGGGDPERTWAVDRDAAIRTMDAAEKAGVGRYVMVSYLGAGPDHGVDESDDFFAYAEGKTQADEHLKKSSLRWTILGPGMLTLDDASGKITVLPEGQQPDNADTSRANVAAVAHAVLSDDTTIGRKINFVDGDTPIAEAISAS